MANSLNKIIQVPIDQRLLAALDELSQAQGSSRSALIRRACHDYLERVRQETLDDAYEQGYRRVPEDSIIGRTQASLAEQVLSEESW